MTIRGEKKKEEEEKDEHCYSAERCYRVKEGKKKEYMTLLGAMRLWEESKKTS